MTTSPHKLSNMKHNFKISKSNNVLNSNGVKSKVIDVSRRASRREPQMYTANDGYGEFMKDNEPNGVRPGLHHSTIQRSNSVTKPRKILESVNSDRLHSKRQMHKNILNLGKQQKGKSEDRTR